MYGQAEIIKPQSTLSSPEVKHFQDLSELNDLSAKCQDLTTKAMKSSIHCASSIAEIKTLFKTEIPNINNCLDSMKLELELMGQDLSIMTAHMGKVNATIYEVQDLIKDKLKTYDEQFELLNKKLSEYGDIIKETNRNVKVPPPPPITPRERPIAPKPLINSSAKKPAIRKITP